MSYSVTLIEQFCFKFDQKIIIQTLWLQYSYLSNVLLQLKHCSISKIHNDKNVLFVY